MFCVTLSVSNRVYMVLSMETTCLSVMWLQMRVNPCITEEEGHITENLGEKTQSVWELFTI